MSRTAGPRRRPRRVRAALVRVDHHLGDAEARPGANLENLPQHAAAVLVGEPQRRRTLLIMLMFMTVSLGSAIGGWVAAKLISAYGWQVIFIIGGFLPLVLCPVLIRLRLDVTLRGRC